MTILMNISKTTIQLSKSTLEDLKLEKLTKRESYDEQITRILYSSKRWKTLTMVAKAKYKSMTIGDTAS
jgi:hypothetical protein